MRNFSAYHLICGSLGLGAMLLGCTDVPTSAPPGSPAFEISDGANSGGNEHFFFLPPMVSDPSASFTAAFDASLSPEVSICLWDEVGGACVRLPVAEFDMTSGMGSEIVRVEPDDELYIVNWHTDDLLSLGDTYRIFVTVEGQELDMPIFVSLIAARS